MNNLKPYQQEYSYTTKNGTKIAHHDISGELVKIGDKVEIQYNSGINQGTPNLVRGIVTNIDDYGNWTLDNPIGELNSNSDYNKNGKTIVKPNNPYDYTDNLGIMHFKGFTKSHGWNFWIKKLKIKN
jgi:hypothetical protein